MIDDVRLGFQRLEEQKSQVLTLLKSKSETELTKSLPEKWSMIQAMRHVQMSEEGSLNYMLKKSQAGDKMKKRTYLVKFYLQILYLVFHLRLKFKAPKAISNPPITSLDQLENDWNATREKLQNFLNEYPEKWRLKAVYRHPFLGLLNVTDAVKFLNAHLTHHTRQLHRIERQIMTLNADDNT